MFDLSAITKTEISRALKSLRKKLVFSKKNPFYADYYVIVKFCSYANSKSYNGVGKKSRILTNFPLEAPKFDGSYGNWKIDHYSAFYAKKEEKFLGKSTRLKLNRHSKVHATTKSGIGRASLASYLNT